MDNHRITIKDSSRKTERVSSINVLNKDIFTNVFKKDIKRVYIYKKVERIAQAIHILAPAFTSRPMLAERFDSIALALVDAAVLPTSESRRIISERLLTLSSLLTVAHSAHLLSAMNIDILMKEIEDLLAEISLYEEPRVTLPDTPTLAEVFAKQSEGESRQPVLARQIRSSSQEAGRTHEPASLRGAERSISQRQKDILGIIKDKQEVYIKDISSVLRDVSEKTIQRELGRLLEEGRIEKTGERRWSRYHLRKG